MSEFFFFFFQAEDGIRDLYVTGVQTCALPICLSVHWAPGLNSDRVGHRIPDHARQVSLGEADRRSEVQASELEKFGYERAHSLGFLLDPPHRVRQLIRSERTLAIELGVTADRRKRRAKLVRGVSGEFADLLLGPQPRAERLLYPVQHRVDRGAEPANFGLVVGFWHPRGQVALRGDLIGGPGHLVQRDETAADKPLTCER